MRDHMFYALAQAIVALNNAKPSLPTASEIEETIFDFVLHWDYIKGELRPAHQDLNEDSLLSAMVAIRQTTGPRDEVMGRTGMAPADMAIGSQCWLESSEALPDGWVIIGVQDSWHLCEKRA